MAQLSIGELSRITGLSVKTLRFYHEKGLLVPAAVDPGSSYRCYDEKNIEKARVIVALRALELSLDEIDEILRRHEDEADILDYLEKQKARLQQSILRHKNIVELLDRIIRNEKGAMQAMRSSSFQPEEKTLEPVLVAGVRMKGKYSDCGKGFARIGRSLGRHICGKPLCLYYDGEYREDDADLEACMPVRRAVDADGIIVRELPGGRCVSLLHQGPYDQLGRSYARVLEYVKERGYKVLLPTREVYLKGPGMIFKGNPRKYLTEIQIPIDTSK